MNQNQIVVLGTLASDPYAGMAWMTMQFAAGLQRLGHDVWYFETTSTWPYDPSREMRVRDSDYSLPYLTRICTEFGLADRWALRRSYLDKAWFGLDKSHAEEILASSDVVFNFTGATKLAEEGLEAKRLVYLGTDPVYHEVTYAAGDPDTRAIIDEHDDVVTYGENIGTPHSPIPPLPNLRTTTRQPVLIDLWQSENPRRPHFTTVGNWKQSGREVLYQGDLYFWSKHHEFLKMIDLPRRVNRPLELATNLHGPQTHDHGANEAVPAFGVESDARELLQKNGWLVTDAPSLTLDPWTYRDYITASSGEFTVARDLNVRLKSGWFSERSACYLAAGKPVITQDTGFGTVLPTGEGLFAFNTMDEAVAAFEAISADYDRHSKAAHDIAQTYFRAETVLQKLLDDLGF